MGQLRLFNPWDDKGLVRHENSQDSYSLPFFFSGESPSVAYMALQRNSAGTAGREPWGIVDPASFGLKIGLYANHNNDQLAFQDTWTNDAALKIKTALLTYDSAKITTALGLYPTGVACTLEIDIQPVAGGCSKSYQGSATLKSGLITPAAATAPLGEVVATQGWVKQIAVPRDGTDPNFNPCDGFFMRSRPGGKIILFYPDDNGQWQREVLS